MATADENKATFRRYVEEVGNKGNLDLVDEIFDRYVSHQSDGHTEERGPEDVKRFMGEFRQAFPDFHSTIEDQIAEEDKVVTRWTMRGTHRGEFRGVAPSGKRITITGIGIFRFSDEGKVVESWDNFDQLGICGRWASSPRRNGLHSRRPPPSSREERRPMSSQRTQKRTYRRG